MSLIHKSQHIEPASSAALSAAKTEMLTLICHISHTQLLQLCRTNRLDAKQLQLCQQLARQLSSCPVHVYYRPLCSTQMLTAMTLGTQTDTWLGETGKKDLLTAYLADQLCWLLLENGYQRWSEALKQLTGQVMTGMHFIGNDEPAELASYLKQLTQSEIRILPGGCMQPLKTVLFLADLAPDNAANKKSAPASACADCPHPCTYRKGSL